MTTVAAEARPVRVTVEGIARPVKHDSRYLFVQHGTHSFLVNSEAEGVTVEDIEPERAWTDGDVVQSVTGLTYTRDGSKWRGISPSGLKLGPHEDVATSDDVRSGFLRVLRYQAGEQQ